MVSNATLVKIAAYGGFFVVGAGYFMRNKIEEGIKKSDYFRESMKQMRTHQGVVSLFGEPIKDGRLNLGENGTNFCDGTQAQFQVPVKGPKAKGTLHLWAERMTYEQPWDVYRLELELKDMPDRIIVLRNVPSKCASSEGS
ncbi:hypothetical protein PR048_025785 [Dryococelus australis]|uniref:Mitochondrial import inner membrane translocase subunit Tim21 n=1 Tax=Dryococelus australis TaxID=614101 RepID=A0ABQ9GJK0_9NEOP|nr:hypothetical protein PR048_025785 [Dryococelus australis]